MASREVQVYNLRDDHLSLVCVTLASRDLKSRTTVGGWAKSRVIFVTGIWSKRALYGSIFLLMEMITYHHSEIWRRIKCSLDE